MLGFESFGVKPFLRYAFPGYYSVTGSTDFVISKHILQEIFSFLLSFGYLGQLFTSFIILLYALIDSQSSKTVSSNEKRGYDGGKKQKDESGI